MDTTPHPPETPPATGSPEPTACQPEVRKSALSFLLALALFMLPGLLAQSASPALGLAWTELFVFLLPAAAAAAGSNLRPAAFLRFAPRPAVSQVALGAVAGASGYVLAGTLMAAAQLLFPQRWIETFDLSRLFHGPAWERIAIAAIASLLAPVCEEGTFRGYVLTAIGLRRSPVAAIAGSAVLFAALHLDPVRLPALLFLGAVFGWLAWRAGSVWPAVAAHAANNATASLLAFSLDAEPPMERPSVAGVVLGLAAGAVVLAPVLAAYRALTPSPPPFRIAIAPRDPALPVGPFSLARVPPAYTALTLLGAIALGLLFLATSARAIMAR